MHVRRFWGPANGRWVPEPTLFKVARVLLGGPMDKAGIQSGDVLEAVDGYPLNGAGVAGSFLPLTKRLPVGDGLQHATAPQSHADVT
jgi:S1-C subfamily serine protease